MRRGRLVLRLGAGLALVLAVTAGCGGQSRDLVAREESAGAPCRGADVSALRLGGTANYIPAVPKEMRDYADLTARVSLVGVHPGFDWNTEDSANPQVIVEFKVLTAYSSDDDSVKAGDSVFVINDQGPIVVETNRPRFDLDYFNTSLPVGTEAFVFLRDVTSKVAPYLEDADLDRTIMSAGLQGVILDDCLGFRGGSDDLPVDGAWEHVTSAEDLEAILRS